MGAWAGQPWTPPQMSTACRHQGQIGTAAAAGRRAGELAELEELGPEAGAGRGQRGGTNVGDAALQRLLIPGNAAILERLLVLDGQDAGGAKHLVDAVVEVRHGSVASGGSACRPRH